MSNFPVSILVTASHIKELDKLSLTVCNKSIVTKNDSKQTTSLAFFLDRMNWYLTRSTSDRFIPGAESRESIARFILNQRLPPSLPLVTRIPNYPILSSVSSKRDLDSCFRFNATLHNSLPVIELNTHEQQSNLLNNFNSRIQDYAPSITLGPSDRICPRIKNDPFIYPTRPAENDNLKHVKMLSNS